MGALALSGMRATKRNPHRVPADFAERSLMRGPVPPANPAMLHAFMLTTGADPNDFTLPGGRTALPPTFYVTWNLAVLARSVRALRLPLDFSRALHAASEVRYTRPLGVDEHAHYHARVVQIDDNERRTRIHVETVVHETDARGAEIFRNTMVLHVRKAPAEKRPRETAEAPLTSGQELAAFRLGRDLGERYAMVAGDFNPIHWSRLAARACGFKTLFAQGYCAKALIAHALIRQLLNGDVTAFQALRVDFRQPVFLPSEVRLFAGEPLHRDGASTRALSLGTAAHEPALVTGTFTYRLS